MRQIKDPAADPVVPAPTQAPPNPQTLPPSALADFYSPTGRKAPIACNICDKFKDCPIRQAVSPASASALCLTYGRLYNLLRFSASLNDQSERGGWSEMTEIKLQTSKS